MNKSGRRLRELDFLRGIAVILVVMRHQHLSWFTTNMGWIGVDLFFVLSGFLIASLLFREFLTFGNIDVKRFLIRRGFKIYPVYYIFFGVYFLFRLIEGFDISDMRLFPELFFVQNYLVGTVYVMPVSWSLAVEEHFYFGLALILWWCIRSKRLQPDGPALHRSWSWFEKCIFIILIICPGLRIASNLLMPEHTGGNTRMTHLRIDSLLAGVLIAYWYFFRQEWLKRQFRLKKIALLIVCIAGLVWTPFFDLYSSFWIKTIGFTSLYISFGIILLYFLLSDNIDQQLNSFFSPALVNAVSRIGFCSYSIYIIHILMILSLRHLTDQYALVIPPLVQIGIVFAGSIAAGMLITYKIEKFFLLVRDRHFPARAILRAQKVKNKETAAKPRYTDTGCPH